MPFRLMIRSDCLVVVGGPVTRISRLASAPHVIWNPDPHAPFRAACGSGFLLPTWCASKMVTLIYNQNRLDPSCCNFHMLWSVVRTNVFSLFYHLYR